MRRQICLLLNADLFLFEIAVFRDEIPLSKVLKILRSLLRKWDRALELADHFTGRLHFRFALRHVGFDASHLRLVVAILSLEPALCLPKCRCGDLSIRRESWSASVFDCIQHGLRTCDLEMR
ncbi:hypothetical protein D3C87_1768250 [compost metagenome]